MKFVSLVSGGKDSVYNTLLCQSHGHELVVLANLYPQSANEIDSFMFQSSGKYCWFASLGDLSSYLNREILIDH